MEYITVVYCHPAYLTYMQSTSYWAVYSEFSTHAELDESQPGIKIAKRNIKNLRYADDTTLMAESRGTKEPLDEGERGEWKSWLKIQHSKTKIVAFGLITSWQIDGEKVETVTDFIFLGSKITVDGDCSHEIKRRLLLGSKAMTNLDSALKSRDITFLTKVYIVKAMVLPVVMYWCECWTLESWAPKNWCFQTVVLEKTLESLLDCN